MFLKTQKNAISVTLLTLVLLIYFADVKAKKELKNISSAHKHQIQKSQLPKPGLSLLKDIRNIPSFQINLKATYLACSNSGRIENLLNANLSFAFQHKTSDRYLKKFQQSVDINTFLANTNELYCATSKLPESRRRQLAEYLFSQLQPHLKSINNSTYFIYNFDYAPLDYNLKRGWFSGLAQAKLLMSIRRLHQITGDKKFEILAKKILLSFRPSNNFGGPAFYDSEGFYWIDEYPSQDKHSFVLNGHIWGLIGLHDYLQQYKDDQSLEYLQRGIDTVKKYIPTFRLPNHINCYDLRICEPDYLPSRTIKQQDWLYHVTSDSQFKKYSEYFKADFSNFKLRKEKSRICAKNPINSTKCFLESFLD